MTNKTLHLSLWILLLGISQLTAADIPPGMKETFRNYLKDSTNVVLVCEVNKKAVEASSPRKKHELHVMATVVGVVKGKGAVGDTLKYYSLIEEAIPEQALKIGDLRFLMLDEYGQDEFLLDTGAGWKFTPELDALIASETANASSLQESKVQTPKRQVECTIPVLPVRNLARSLTFYTETLGFKVDWGGEEGSAISSVSRDKCCIMLMQQPKIESPGWVWIGADVSLFDLYRSKGVEIAQEPRNYSWAYEMKFKDIDGNILWLGTDPRTDLPFEK